MTLMPSIDDDVRKYFARERIHSRANIEQARFPIIDSQTASDEQTSPADTLHDALLYLSDARSSLVEIGRRAACLLCLMIPTESPATSTQTHLRPLLTPYRTHQPNSA